MFKQVNIDSVVVYSSYPVRSVIGEFKIDDVLVDDINTIWEKTAPNSGISKSFYQNYFCDKSFAIAIKIGKTKL